MSEVIEAWNLIDRPDANGQIIGEYWNECFGSSIPIDVTHRESEQGSTDVVHWTIPGTSGKMNGGQARGITVVGRLGGVGARPAYPGTVSDADGAVIATAVALKLSRAYMLGEATIGDVHVVTHICPNAAVKDIPIEGQMRGPLPAGLLLAEEARPETDALLSIDTTRGHRIANHTGISITPTLMRGYLLRVSDSLLNIYSDVTNELPHVLPITVQDIFPGDGQFYRINSIMAHGGYFRGPIVGVATVSSSTVFGRATGAAPPNTLETAARFCVEVCRRFGHGRAEFYDPVEFGRIVERFGSLEHLVKGR